MNHKDWIKGYENDFERLATEIGDLKYDALEKFLSLLSEKIEEDANKDKARGRNKLGGKLEVCSQKLKDASESIQKAWVICEPYMPTDRILNKK